MARGCMYLADYDGVGIVARTPQEVMKRLLNLEKEAYYPGWRSLVTAELVGPDEHGDYAVEIHYANELVESVRVRRDCIA